MPTSNMLQDPYGTADGDVHLVAMDTDGFNNSEEHGFAVLSDIELAAGTVSVVAKRSRQRLSPVYRSRRSRRTAAAGQGPEPESEREHRVRHRPSAEQFRTAIPRCAQRSLGLHRRRVRIRREIAALLLPEHRSAFLGDVRVRRRSPNHDRQAAHPKRRGVRADRFPRDGPVDPDCRRTGYPRPEEGDGRQLRAPAALHRNDLPSSWKPRRRGISPLGGWVRSTSTPTR